MVKTRLLLWGLALGLLTLLVVGCDDDDKPCPTCPEPNPAVVAALNYVDAHQAELGLRDEVDQMVSYRVQEDRYGFTHVRCHQFYKGVRVEGGELIVHLDTALEVSRVTDGIIRDVQVDVISAISALTAARVASEDFASGVYHVKQEGGAEKVVYRWLDTDHLCWVMTLQAVDGFDVREYYIDAHSGDIVRWRSLVIE
jgi:Zn-dependent metalloprotease